MLESASIEDVYKQYYRDLIVFGLMFESDPCLVKDAINDLFLELCEKPHYLAKARSPKAYLSICVKNRLLKGKKKDQLHVEPLDLSLIADLVSADDVAEVEEMHSALQKRVNNAISRLTPRQREIIQLKFFLKKDTDEIVSLTGMNTKTVYNTLSTALKTIRADLKHGIWLVIYIYYWL